MTDHANDVLTMSGVQMYDRFVTNVNFGPALAALRDAVVAAVRAERREPPTDMDIGEVWNPVWPGSMGSRELQFARNVLARYAPVPPDDAGVREREALTKFADSQDDGSMAGRHAASRAYTFRDREYPAPTPPAPPSVPLSDGSVVTGDPMFTIWTRSWPSLDVPRTCTDWRQLLNQPTDTGADFDAVKALAASVAREGR